MFSRKITVKTSGITRVAQAYMHAMSLNPFASLAAINTMIVWRFTAVRTGPDLTDARP